MSPVVSTGYLSSLLDFILAQEKSATKIYANYSKSKGFDPAKFFAKTQTQVIFQVTRELRSLLQKWDEAANDPAFQQYYPENQPSFDEAPIQLIQEHKRKPHTTGSLASRS